jgi:peptidoglycan/xylan/chitin deacetylase (PgdA/CDA1 family)
MKDKQLLLTFDYELFLGGNSGSVLQCMLEPTEKIIPILKKHGLKAVFFIDTTYLMQLEKQALSHSLAKNDLNQIIKQLNNLIKDGHYLFHHLHPHWLDAIYNPESNTWDCSNHTHFALSNLTDEQISSLFTYSDNFIKGLYPEKNKPAFLGFRAGGLYSQPFELLSQ